MGIVIVGAGSLGREVLAALRAANQPVAGFLVDPGHRQALSIHGVEVRDDPSEWIGREDASFVLAVGDGRMRARLARDLSGAAFASAVHPAATIGPYVACGEGLMVIGPSSFTTDIAMGAHVLVNPGCSVAHDCSIGAFVSLSPGVALAGRVVVEEGAFLGVGAVVAPGCRVGAWSVVGAGAAVIRDVAPGTTVAGVPARLLPKRGQCRGEKD